MTKTEKTPFHLVDSSPWPILTASSVFVVTTGGVLFMHGHDSGMVMGIGIVMLVSSMSFWLRDVVREGTLEGQHTTVVQVGLRFGMMLFILSEIMFFVAFFWGFFWSSISPSVEIGGIWPPKGIEVMNAWEIPFLNTLILLSSGASVTWAHHSIVVGNRTEAIASLIITVLLAAIFSGLQAFEYVNAGFDISDGVYGSTFYMATGFHGVHVILGTIMLLVSLVRVWRYEMTKQHHFGFESAAWYWHFVDVVWLFLFVSIYWWGS